MKVRCCSRLRMSRKKKRAQFNFTLSLRERGITVPFVSGGFETRPYGTGTRGFWHRGIGGILASSCPITSTASSYWWYFGIIVLARAFFALSCCRGGYITRPHGDTSYGDFGIIILARVFLHYRIWWAGLKPAPTGVRWGCCAQSRQRYRRIGGGFGIIVLARGSRPYRGSLWLLCPITSTASS